MGEKKKIAKSEKPKQEHWQKLVEVFFDFCREKFNDQPSFTGSSPRDLSDIVVILKLRAEKSNVIWDEGEAKKRLRGFLDKAFEDDWLSRNFLLPQLNRFKDKVFLNLITPKRNGNIYQRSIRKQPDTEANTSGGFGEL